MFAKIDVKGEQAHPLFKHLKKELPDWLGGKEKWNFTKFLLDTEGKPVRRSSPTTKLEKMEK